MDTVIITVITDENYKDLQLLFEEYSDNYYNKVEKKWLVKNKEGTIIQHNVHLRIESMHIFTKMYTYMYSCEGELVMLKDPLGIVTRFL